MTSAHTLPPLAHEEATPALELQLSSQSPPRSPVVEGVGEDDPTSKKMKEVINLDDAEVKPPCTFHCNVWDKSFLDHHEDYQLLDSLILTPKD